MFTARKHKTTLPGRMQASHIIRIDRECDAVPEVDLGDLFSVAQGFNKIHNLSVNINLAYLGYVH